jgi:diguanylate cyclase (GGDEF)-like protein
MAAVPKSRDPEIMLTAQSETNDTGYRAHMQTALSIPSKNFFAFAAESLAKIFGVKYIFIINQHNEKKLFIVSEDITKRYQLAQALSHQATHDSLTQLLNRPEFERQLKLMLASDDTKHTICYLELDQFKIINDACGHLAGDALLKNIARLLDSKISANDVFARLGGDEFGILMKNCSLEQAAKATEDIRQLIEDYEFIWENRKYSVGVSIGFVAIDSTNRN